MSKSVKFVVSIYLTVVVLICCTYLAMILVGSLQGNDMRDAVLDTNNTKDIENVEYNNNSSSDKTTTESSSMPDELQSNHTNKFKIETLSQDINSHTSSLDSTISKSHV
ncbi:MAG TPA: hypothetical protein VK115_05760 [Staphylococcus sp.]|nr:hypothetical protein [Staphylococcus sp.]